MKYCGIDLHSNNSVVVVSDEEDRIVFRQRLPNDLGQIRAALEPHREELAGVVIESTYNWYWLVDGLMDAGYRVHLAHPSAIKKYEGLKHSGDFADAAYLAQLLRLGLLPEGYIYPREERGARDLARKRMQLVRYRTAQILSIENILIRQTGARMRGEAVKRLTAEQVEAFGFAPMWRWPWRPTARSAKRWDSRSQRWRGGSRNGCDCARSIGCSRLGIGEMLATTIMLETGHIGRFAQVGNFSSYCRCVESLRESNGKKKGEGNTKNGNKYLAWALWRRRTSRCATARRPRASMSARRAGRIASWRSRLWRTNWRGPATTCCGTRSPSMCAGVSGNGLAKGGEPGKRTGVKLLE